MVLDRIERETWRQTTLNKVALIQEQIRQTAMTKSLRQRDRTHDEEIIAAERHEAESSRVPVSGRETFQDIALAEANKVVLAESCRGDIPKSKLFKTVSCGEEV